MSISRKLPKLRGQGATEYLVLLAVVLIIALVAVALLAFLPGTASDSRVAESQGYWSSATPLAITASSASRDPYSTIHYPFLKIQNTGSDPIRLKQIVAGTSTLTTYTNTVTASTNNPLTDILIAPGKSICFGGFNSGCPYLIRMVPSGSTYSGSDGLAGLSTMCDPTTGSGVFTVENLGFVFDKIHGSSMTTMRMDGAASLVSTCGSCTYVTGGGYYATAYTWSGGFAGVYFTGSTGRGCG